MVAAARLVGPANIAQFDLLRWLSPAVQDEFRRATHVRKLSKGEIIYADGDVEGGMYRVHSGSVRLLSAEAGGHELLYLLFGPGDCFGISSCIDGEPRAHTTEAGSNAELAVLPRQAFDRLRRQHREFDNALLQVLSRYMRKLSSSLSQSELDDLPTRVAGRLVDAARSFGIQSDDGVHLSVRISQAELALMVGSSRQSVNKVLQRFRDQGLIAIEYGAFVVREEGRLSRLARPAARH